MLYINPDLHSLLRNYTFEDFMRLDGETYRSDTRTGRCTKRVLIGGRAFFLKCHTGCGWKEILKNLLCGKRPVVSAAHEYRALEKLPRLGVPTPGLAAYGRKGTNPARIRSFVLTESLEHSESLETFLPRFFSAADTPDKQQLKHAILQRAAEIARKLHSNNLFHQDFYICHLHIDLSYGENNLTPEAVKLYLMDLHRVKRARILSARYRRKDVAGLYFSAMDTPLTKTDLARFIKDYRQCRDLKEATRLGGAHFWKAVNRRAIGLYRRITGRDVEPRDTCFPNAGRGIRTKK